MHDYERLIVRSQDCISGLIEESNDDRNHQYKTKLHLSPHGSAVLIALATEMNLIQGPFASKSPFRGCIYDETVQITTRDKTGTSVGVITIPIGYRLSLTGKARFKKMLLLECPFEQVHQASVHFR